mgnify:CR=1 FL=1
MNDNSQFNRTLVFVSLGLAVALVVAVLIGSRFYYTTVAQAPVAVSPVDSPEAESTKGNELLDALPNNFMGARRAEIAEPAPKGVAAWRDAQTDNDVTLRCGVRLPYQYTDYSVLTELPQTGSSWLKVKDQTPGSNLTTWYSVETAPTVAVTSSGDAAPDNLDLTTLAAPVAKAFPAPLSTLKSATLDSKGESACASLDEDLPTELGEGYTAQANAQDSSNGAFTRVWAGEGLEPVVLRCGVQPPENYRAGEKLQQINEVPWFQDTTLAEGTTAGTWFALGRSVDIAVSTPQSAAEKVLPQLTQVISSATPEQS